MSALLIDNHKKNIDLLGLKIIESSSSGQKHRVFIKDNKDIVSNGASI